MIGLGPEDPAADLCAAIMGTVVEVGCLKVVKAGKSFGVDECKAAVGCASPSPPPPPPPLPPSPPARGLIVALESLHSRGEYMNAGGSDKSNVVLWHEPKDHTSQFIIHYVGDLGGASVIALESVHSLGEYVNAGGDDNSNVVLWHEPKDHTSQFVFHDLGQTDGKKTVALESVHSPGEFVNAGGDDKTKFVLWHTLADHTSQFLVHYPDNDSSGNEQSAPNTLFSNWTSFLV
jgi:WD40 repeat protein